MYALEKHASKKKLIEGLKGALGRAQKGTKNYVETVKGTRVAKAKKTHSSAAAKLDELAKNKPATKGRKRKGAAGRWQRKQREAQGSLQQSSSRITKEQAATSKARKQAAGGFAGLAGLAGLGLGARALGKRSASKAAIKGTQSAAARLGAMARKNKKSLAIGGGAVGAAAGLNALVGKKKKKAA